MEYKTYPEQSQYVKGSKIWLELENEQILVVSPQARKVLKWAKIDEEKFIQKLKELLVESFGNLEFPFHRLSVSKASEDVDEESESPYIQISIRDQHSKPINP